MKLHLVHLHENVTWPSEIGLRQRLRTVGAGGVGSRANLSEALRAVALAKRLAEQLGQGAVAVLSWYNSQVGGWEIQREFLIVFVGT